jgi:2-polyprenyl-3-methyl-5-hydroxy-6-metoxy-1,4-benzoquinol methylase
MHCEICDKFLEINDSDFYFCEQCDLWTADKNKKDIRKLYTGEYQSLEISRHSIDQLKKEWDTNIFLIKKFKSHGKLLEVGFRDGVSMLALEDAGFDVYGFDISKESEELAVSNGVSRDKIYIDNELHIVNFNNKFDVITVREVIEHVPYPELLVYSCYKNLNENGIVHIQTPRHSFIVDNWKEKTHLRTYSVHSLITQVIKYFIIKDVLMWEGGMCVTAEKYSKE